MRNRRICPQCGTERTDDSLGGLCPKCLARYSFLELEGDAGGAEPEEGPGETIEMELEKDIELERTGMMIGRYKLLEQIGEGGFGVVYMAEQVEPVQRRVALKVIKAGMDTREVIVRFEAERQALALMDHPNIARVLDAGTTKAGRPYFVMELVRGIPITEFCDQKNLSPNDRLDLFMKVCHAVQHAHQKGIIHRDLKPSNILVTLHDGEAVPKIIDFGVAKALGAKLTEKTLFTGFAHMLGTPAYMSPEQAELSGLDVDTRSDIYSLGVLLYELLTGVTPLAREVLAKAALDEVRRMIREKDPARPSTRLQTLGDKLPDVAKHRHIEPLKLIHLVRGDLDWIVMKCLEKDRTRRYETANGIAVDVQRHLEDEPVVARPPTAAYRLRKLVQRNKLTFAATGAVAAALILGLGVSTVALFREKAARERAVSAERKQVQLREQAELAAERESALRKQSEQLAEANRQNLYASRINQAWHVFQESDIARVLELLDSLSPKPGESDLRGFEWYYLWRLCHSERFDLIGHADPVRSVAFSPDGLMLASAGNGSTIRLWDTRTGRETRALGGAGGWITSVSFSLDGKWLACGSTDNSVVLWDVVSGTLQHIFRGHTNPVSVVRFSPQGDLLASATADVPTGSGNPTVRFLGPMTAVGELKLWDLETRNERATLPGHPKGIRDLAFSPDGQMLASGGIDRALRVWDVSTHRLVACRTNFAGPIFSLAFAPGGKVLATAGGYPHHVSAEIKFWKAPGFEETSVLHEELPLSFSIAFTPDGRNLVTGDKNRMIRLLDLDTGLTRGTWRGHKTFVWSVAVSPDGRTLASADWDGAVKMWDVTQTQETQVFPAEEAGDYSLAFSPDGKRIAVGGSRVRTLTVWDTDTAELLFSGSMPDGDVVVAISNDGKTLAAAGSEGVVQLWDFRLLEHTGSLTGHVNKIWSMAFSPDSQTLATGGDTGVIELWSMRSGTRLSSLEGHTRSVQGLAFMPDGRTLFSGSGNELKVWNTQTFREQTGLPEPGGRLKVSPNGRMLAHGQVGRGIVVRSLPDLRHLVTLRGHTGSIYSTAFSPDNKTLATASWDRTVRLWHAATGQEMLSFVAGGGVAWSVAFSPDSRLLAFSSGSARKGEISFVRAATETEVQAENAATRASDAPPIVTLPVPKSQLVMQILQRDPGAAPEMIDLTDHYNGSLTHGWTPPTASATTAQSGLSQLPLGMQVFSGVRFDVRGVVQLAGKSLNETLGASFPVQVDGIRVNQKCQRLHFLHGTTWPSPDGTTIGRYIIHYASGAQQEVAVICGDNIRGLRRPEEPTENAVVAWTGKTALRRKLDQEQRLYKFTWENPLPDTIIESIDFVSLYTRSSPFLIAITAEP